MVAYDHMSVNAFPGALLGFAPWTVIGDRREGGGCCEFGIEGDDDNRSVACVGLPVFNVSILIPLDAVVCDFAGVAVTVGFSVVDC